MEIPTHQIRAVYFEAVSQMSEEDQCVIQSIIDGMILKHTANSLSASSSK